MRQLIFGVMRSNFGLLYGNKFFGDFFGKNRRDGSSMTQSNDNNSETEEVKVIMYSTVHCPYCRLARQFFDKREVGYTEIMVDKERGMREEMEQRSNRTSVPQIFINGFHVGGFEDLADLDLEGDLEALLNPV